MGTVPPLRGLSPISFPVAEWPCGFIKLPERAQTKEKTDEYGKVINRLRDGAGRVEEKGRGKEKVPLHPLKRKGEGKRTRPGFL